MKELSYTITDPVGIHARPAGMLIKELSQYASTITISRGSDSCDGKKLLALMKLRVKQGETIVVKADGADEDAAIEGAKAFLSANL
ncbi:MAG: HPr family phosphocarrier protein [Spirochaetaceae bacterium]|jgi:phosphocarrier protein|nr:HPr family phosphocarrier protein [Spirochaetaceae bacterium]